MANQFMIGVEWFFNAIQTIWNWLISLGFVGYCVIGLLVVKRVGKLISRVLHK